MTKNTRTRTRPARAKLLAAVAAGATTRKELLKIVSSSTIQRAVADGDLVKHRAGKQVSYSAPVRAQEQPAHVVTGKTHDGLPCEGVPGGRVHALATLLAGKQQTLRQRIAEAASIIGW